jgi:metal-responsive CopG/Arc/MetJ family transcriptional regulator
MTTAVKKTVSLPPELAREAEEAARNEGKTLSAVIQDALRLRGRCGSKGNSIQYRGFGVGRQKKKEF